MILSGETAVVTGASRGIGYAIASALGQQGAFVVATSTSADGASDCEARLRGAGIDAHGTMLDVSSTDSVGAFYSRLAERRRQPSILVNNAGITRDGLLARMNERDWGDVIELISGRSIACAKRAPGIS